MPAYPGCSGKRPLNRCSSSNCLGLAFCVYFWFSLGYFILVYFAFAVLGLVSSELCKRLAGKNVSEMTCVKLDVKC